MRKATVVLSLLLLASQALAGGREYAFDLWDWTAPGADLATFKKWAEDLKKVGVTRVEMSAPWAKLEPKPGEYDLSFVTDRIAAAKALGMGVRIRINSCWWGGATPGWLECDRQTQADGKLAPMAIPSINDERFWKSFGPLCTEISRKLKGENVYFSPFIGMHAELKWSDWWTFDPSNLRLWREAIHQSPRPEWLARVVGDATLPETPAVPPATDGTPDLSPASRAFIAFREHSLRDAVRRFVDAVHAGDPLAKVSVPLGESYRRQSAEMSNLDYWGLSRGAVQVVHSYDFFWHAKQDAWWAGAAVASFRGITGLETEFEFDGPNLTSDLGYSEGSLRGIAEAAMREGAGLKLANYSYSPKLPSEWGLVRKFGEMTAAAGVKAEPAKGKTILLFVSKWANYCYREKTEWLHEAQFGAWKMLSDMGLAVRIVCEDNLGEDLSGYGGMYVAWSPEEVMPGEDVRRLREWEGRLGAVVEVEAVPEIRPTGKEEVGEVRVEGRRAVMERGVAYGWLKGRVEEAGRVKEAMRRVGM